MCQAVWAAQRIKEAEPKGVAKVAEEIRLTLIGFSRELNNYVWQSRAEAKMAFAKTKYFEIVSEHWNGFDTRTRKSVIEYVRTNADGKQAIEIYNELLPVFELH